MPVELKPAATKSRDSSESLAQQESHIWGEAFGAIEEFANPNIFQRWNAPHGGFQNRGELVEIFRQFGKFKILGDGIEGPGLGLGFKGPQQQFPRIFFKIGAIIRIAQYRQIRG